MSAGVSTGVLTFQDVLNTAVLFSLSMAWQLGRAVKWARLTHNSVLQAIANQQHGIILVTGKVRNAPTFSSTIIMLQ